jgi:hypothetical protein
MMSLIFKPRIAYHFGSAKFLASKAKASNSHQEQYTWEEREIEFLIELRALKVSFLQCDKMLKRKQGSCSNCIQSRNLYEKINSKRQALIQGVLKDD